MGVGTTTEENTGTTRSGEMTHFSNTAGANATLSYDNRDNFRWIKTVGTILAFWSAIVLPLFYLPLLFTRLETPIELLLFLGLFGLHVLTLIVGHPVRAPTE